MPVVTGTQNVASCTFRNSFKVKCPPGGVKSVFAFFINVNLATLYCVVCCTYHGSSEIKCAEKLMLYCV